jgi:YbgC/YbaW family acyl-CoA thioester hydrolase
MEKSTPCPIESRFRVRGYELDSFGHVNNAVYLNYLEAARGEFLLKAGLSYRDFARWNAYPVVRRAELSFRAPLEVEEEFVVRGFLEALRRTGFRAHQQIQKLPSGLIALEAKIELVFTDSLGRPTAVPELFRERVLSSAIR